MKKRKYKPSERHKNMLSGVDDYSPKTNKAGTRIYPRNVPVSELTEFEAKELLCVTFDFMADEYGLIIERGRALRSFRSNRLRETLSPPKKTK